MASPAPPPQRHPRAPRREVVWWLPFLLLLAALLGAARADTGETKRFTCPLCEKTFEDFVASSGTSFGCRLDFKAVGPTFSPWPVPRCTHCGFVLYDDEIDEEQKKRLRAFVAGDSYAPVWKEHTDFCCLGLLVEACEEWSPMSLAGCFLKATWELGDEDKRYPAYATKAIGYYAKVPAPKEEDAPVDEAERARTEYLIAQYMQVELHRRSGVFDAAQRVLAQIAELDREGAPDWYERAVAFQTTLVAKQDKAPHEFRELPPAEDEEQEDGGEPADEPTEEPKEE